MIKRRTVILAFILCPIVGVISLTPYELTRSGYEVNNTLVVFGVSMTIVSALTLICSFLSIFFSMGLLFLLSIPGGVELMIKARNPFQLLAWKEAMEKYEQSVELHKENLQKEKISGI